MRAKILEYVPNLLANHMIRQNISVLKISAYLSDFSAIVCEALRSHFDDFGLTLDNFSFHSINVPDEDLRVINEAKIQRKKDRIEAEGTAAKMDIESAARARMREREGYSYQQERSFDVMKAAAENEGTAGNMMGTSMGLGMGFGIGDALGAGMGSIAHNTIDAMNQAPVQSAPVQGNTCPKCGAACAPEAKFCLNCGEKLASAGTVCPECGTALPAGAKFCMNCGHKLEAACPNCGNKLAPGAKFCPECGTKI